MLAEVTRGERVESVHHGHVAVVTAPQRAARMFGVTAALRETRGAPRPPAEQAPYERAVTGLQHALGEPAFAAAFSAGQALPLEQASAEALAVCERRS